MKQKILPGIEVPGDIPRQIPSQPESIDIPESTPVPVLPDPNRLRLPGLELVQNRCSESTQPDEPVTDEPAADVSVTDAWPHPSTFLSACPFEIPSSGQPDKKCSPEAIDDLNPLSLTVLGLGITDAPLPEAHARILEQATLLAGGRRLLNRFAKHPARKLIYAAPPTLTSATSASLPASANTLSAVQPDWEEGGIGDVFIQNLTRYQAQGHSIVVLADGDPLFFGIGATLCAAFPHSVRIIPALSCLQEACARLGHAWTETATVSLHGRTDWRPFTAALLDHKPVCVLTDARNSPDSLARFMLDRGVDAYSMHIFSRLGSPEELHQRHSLREAACLRFPPACTVMLLPEGAPRVLCLGLDDHTLATENSLFTKQPVRAAALASLSISPTDTVWDIGAGSGAVALEAAALARSGQVFACEQQPARVLCIQENRRRFGAANLEIITGDVCSTLSTLPTPQKIFVGGSLTRSPEFLPQLCARLAPHGKICISCVLLSTLELCRACFKKLGWNAELLCLNSAESQNLAHDVHLVAHNPVFLVYASKK